MADSLSELIRLKREQGFYESGGQEEYATDKLNRAFGTLRQTGLDINKIRNESIEMALKKKAAQIAEEQAGREKVKFEQEYALPKPLPQGVEGPQEEPVSLFRKTKETAMDLQRSEAEKNRRPAPPVKGGIHRIISKKTGKTLYEFPSSPGTGDTITVVGEDGKDDKNIAKEDAASRRGVAVAKNYYTSLRALQGQDAIGAGKSAMLGVEGLISRAPVVGRSMTKDMSQITGMRTSQGARLAGAMGDSGNKALAEQKNALELLAPPGTRDLDIAEKQALATLLEGIKNKTPEEEKEYQEALKAFEMGKAESQSGGQSAVPKVGEMFNGEKVIGVKKIQ